MSTLRYPLLIPILIAAGTGAPAIAQITAHPWQPLGVATLSSSATVEVDRDLLTITLSTSKDGADAALVQSQLKQALDAALAEARKAARPGQVEIRTGQFTLAPRYTARGVTSGWQGTTELVLEGRDMPAIAQLTGRITTLTVARVGYGLSREVREAAEAEVTAQAIVRFRAQAASYAKQFGYAGYEIREVNVATQQPQPFGPRPMLMQARAADSAAAEPLPIEAGKGSVTANVNGSVQMK
ncbi:MAG: SIMPL domain-containing protein [Burkholderiaceae bacterium]